MVFVHVQGDVCVHRGVYVHRCVCVQGGGICKVIYGGYVCVCSGVFVSKDVCAGVCCV